MSGSGRCFTFNISNSPFCLWTPRANVQDPINKKWRGERKKNTRRTTTASDAGWRPDSIGRSRKVEKIYCRWNSHKTKATRSLNHKNKHESDARLDRIDSLIFRYLPMQNWAEFRVTHATGEKNISMKSNSCQVKHSHSISEASYDSPHTVIRHVKNDSSFVASLTGIESKNVCDFHHAFSTDLEIYEKFKYSTSVDLWTVLCENST